jgi:DnaJ family protein C protein 3
MCKIKLIPNAYQIRRVAQLNPSDPDILILLSKINFYALFEPQGALTHIKQCLHYDPEQKQCKKLFRKMKKLDKEITSIEKDIGLKKYATAANHLIGTANREGILKQVEADFSDLEKELKTDKLPRKLHLKCYQMACKLYGEQKEKNEEKIETWCSKTLEIDSDDVDALSYRGEILLNRKEFESAVRDLERANELTEGRKPHIRQLLQQAHQKLKLSKKRDYYKVLDVSPNADTREIKKAYRKKAHEWHPDKYNGDLDKEQVERKMAEINQAYEVLSDAGKVSPYLQIGRVIKLFFYMYRQKTAIR